MPVMTFKHSPLALLLGTLLLPPGAAAPLHQEQDRSPRLAPSALSPEQAPGSLGLSLAEVQPRERPPLAAQDQDEELSDDRTSKQKRILKLAGGGHLRTLSQFVDGHWHLRRDSKWIEVEESRVLSWRFEAEVEREAKRLARALEAHEHGRRVELAKWMLGEGLVEEATDEVERVLHLEPDFKAAIEFLRHGSIPRPMVGHYESDPGAYVERILAGGVSAGPVDRELLIQRLEPLANLSGGPELLRDSLRKQLHSARILRRTFAAHALRRLMIFESPEMYALMQRCVLDTSRPVREEAARAVKATGAPGIVKPLIKALASESRAVRTNAAESLGNIGFNSAVPALVTHFTSLPQSGGGTIDKVAAHIYVGSHYAYVGDFDLEIAQGSSIADPIVMHGQEAKILDARLAGISGYTYKTEYRSVYGALKQLTGANPGSSPKDWQRWFKENEKSFTPDSAPLPD